MANHTVTIRYFVLLLCISYYDAWAAPSLTSATVSGTIADGQQITISNGSGFGSTGPTVTLFDDFEGGSNGNIINNTSAVIGSWQDGGEHLTPSYYSIYSNTHAHGGSLSARQNWSNAPNPDGGAMWIGANLPSNTSSIYFSFWTYLPTGQNVPGSMISLPNWKVWWLQTALVGNVNDYASEIVTDPPTETTIAWVDGSQNRIYVGWTSFSFTKGRWLRWEGYLTASTSTGTITLWLMDSGNTRYQLGTSTGRTIDNGTTGWNYLWFPGYARRDTNSNTYYDDFYIATGAGARARVEIGNNATYTSCTNLTVCTPTSWSDTSITATVRGGSFTSGTAYLFVTDASGVTSAGKEITFGSGSSPSTPSFTGVMTGSIR